MTVLQIVVVGVCAANAAMAAMAAVRGIGPSKWLETNVWAMFAAIWWMLFRG